MMSSYNVYRLLNKPRATTLPITSNYIEPIASVPTMPSYSMNVDPEWLNTFSPAQVVVEKLTMDDANNPGVQALGEEPDAWFADSNIAVFVSTAVTRESNMVASRSQTSIADYQDHVNRRQG